MLSSFLDGPYKSSTSNLLIKSRHGFNKAASPKKAINDRKDYDKLDSVPVLAPSSQFLMTKFQKTKFQPRHQQFSSHDYELSHHIPLSRMR